MSEGTACRLHQCGMHCMHDTCMLHTLCLNPPRALFACSGACVQNQMPQCSQVPTALGVGMLSMWRKLHCGAACAAQVPSPSAPCPCTITTRVNAQPSGTCAVHAVPVGGLALLGVVLVFGLVWLWETHGGCRCLNSLLLGVGLARWGRSVHAILQCVHGGSARLLHNRGITHTAVSSSGA